MAVAASRRRKRSLTTGTRTTLMTASAAPTGTAQAMGQRPMYSGMATSDTRAPALTRASSAGSEGDHASGGDDRIGPRHEESVGA